MPCKTSRKVQKAAMPEIEKAEDMAMNSQRSQKGNVEKRLEGE